jgi:hypothetical protein
MILIISLSAKEAEANPMPSAKNDDPLSSKYMVNVSSLFIIRKQERNCCTWASNYSLRSVEKQRVFEMK